MTTAAEHTAASCPVSPSTERVRQHRERRRKRHCLFTVEVPESVIEASIQRRFLKPEDRADAWAVLQACYASMISDKALDWLVRNGVIRNEQRADAVAILRGIGTWLEQGGA